jgi:hypothetical protein
MASKTTAAGSPDLRDDGHVVALAPGLQLFAGSSTEGVAGGQQHALALGLEILGQLADRGRLAGPVDPGDHDHVGLVGGVIERLLKRLQGFEQGVGQRLLDRFRRVQLVALGRLLQFVEQMGRRLDAAVAGQQQGFQFLEQFVIDLAAREDGLQLAAPLGARLGQPLEQALAPGRFGRFGRRGVSRNFRLGVGRGFFRKLNMGKVVSSLADRRTASR